MHGVHAWRIVSYVSSYSAYSALGRMFADFAVQCTWEGDNTVMALQTARYLVNCYEKVKRREKVAGSVAYLASLKRINKRTRQWRVKHAGHLRNFDHLLDAFRFLLAKKVERVAQAYAKQRAKVRPSDHIIMAWYRYGR